MKINIFKVFSILIMCSFLLPAVSFFVSAEERGLETQYPIIGGQGITTSTTIAEYAVYIFKFSMILAAIIAFAVLIYGGFRYVTSAGDPTAMADAKAWILSGIIGLALILFSYLLLMMINPDFEEPSVKDIDAVGGIVLIDENGLEKSIYSIGEFPEIPEDFNAVKIKFASNPPLDKKYDDPNKEELISIFYYSETNREGNVEEIKNNKSPDSDELSAEQPLSFSPRSILFFWQKPGVYLYEEENHKTPPVPKVCIESQRTLKDFNDRAKSIGFVEEKPNPWRNPYWIILFKNTDYEGACGAYSSTNSTTEIQGSLKENVSSISFFRGTIPQGDIIFYDKMNCQGNEYIYRPSSLLFRYDSVSLDDDTKDLKQWLSLKINGNFSVLLIIKNHSGSLSYLGERCLLLRGTSCIPSFKGSIIYSADPEGFRPKQAYIFPTME